MGYRNVRVGAIRLCVRIPSVPSEAEGLPCLAFPPAPLLGLGVEESLELAEARRVDRSGKGWKGALTGPNWSKGGHEKQDKVSPEN
jgi:hypothetical protein